MAKKKLSKRLVKRTFSIDVYGGDVTVVICEDIPHATRKVMGREFYKWVVKHQGKDYLSGDTFRAVTMTGDNGSVVFFPGVDAPETAAIHEAFHVTERVMARCDIHHSRETSEPWAYLMGFVAGQIKDAYAELKKEYRNADA